MRNYQYLKNYKMESMSLDNIRYRAELRNIFLSLDNHSIQRLLREDLYNYFGIEADISRLKLVSMDHFTLSMAERIFPIHKNPLVFRFSDDTNETGKEDFIKLMNEVQLNPFLARTDPRFRLHNTIICAVRYIPSMDKIELDNSYDASNTYVISYPSMPTEAKTIIRGYYENGEMKYYGYDKENMIQFVLLEEPKIQNGMLVNNLYDIQEMAYFPFVTFRYSPQNYGFWQNGYDAVVELNRVLNTLITILAEDSLQESIKYVLLPYPPTEQGDMLYEGKSSADGLYDETSTQKTQKAGMSNPIMGNPFRTDQPYQGQVLQADLNNGVFLDTMERIGDMVASLHGVPSPLKDLVLRDVSSIAMRIKLEGMNKNNKRDIDICRPYDRALIEKIVEVNNTERKNKISDDTLKNLVVDYKEIQIVTDDAAEFELERQYWQANVSNPVLFVMRKNPEMTEKQAIEFIEQNKAKNEELLDGLNLATLATGSVNALTADDLLGDLDA